ncbi:protein ROOT PRIMORDIUM DEFECTIVE 1 [Euphorbia lathyris]|uniref:protein ROOT PRIMORDIUM DEFECTIVE 1 n=1 Tax=Euphorbia lathyris TaxID=212925 RepID=UPI00331313F0
MRRQIFEAVLGHPCRASITVRSMTTSAQYVASRFRDPTFEKLMSKYKNLNKVFAIQDLILANHIDVPPSVSIDFLSRLSQKLHLNRGAASFLRKYPHIFHIFYNPKVSQPFCKLTDNVHHISNLEAEAIKATLPTVIDRLVRLLSMSASKSLPLRAIFKVWKELGLPDDFEDSVISQNPHLFTLCDAHEPNTHILKLVKEFPNNHFTAAVENWRMIECCNEDCSINKTEIQFSFKHQYPPGMKLKKNFRAKEKEWKKLPYVGPYDELGEKKRSRTGPAALEKRSVAIVHEFLSLTVEKMVEVEKISHFRKCFGIDLNIRDLFLDHPGIFYLSTKGKKHTVFLREAYERGRVIDSNPVYDARRKLLDLIILGRHDMLPSKLKCDGIGKGEESAARNENND